jgi:hypothetical protein
MNEPTANADTVAIYLRHCSPMSYPMEKPMLTDQDVRDAIAKHGEAPHFHRLCFETADLVLRAKWQAIFLMMGAGLTGNLDPTEQEIRLTPAGQTIPADEKIPVMAHRSNCKSGMCRPRPKPRIGA